MGDKVCCEHCATTTEAVADLRVGVAEISAGQRWQSESLARIEEGMVTRHEFRPVRAVAFGLVAAILLAVVGWAGAALLRVPR
jgi:hypothetical protein